ncbi:MAG: hypothetical protein R3B81_14145 [bacterium]
MNHAVRSRSLLILALLALSALTSPAGAQDTSFTYQGRLDDGAVPAAGLHDIVFWLYDAEVGGTQIGLTQCIDDVEVTDGVFTVQLDFGPQFATSADRYLEIAVRADTGLTCGDGTGLELLTPRQRITSTPRAGHAGSAFALDAPDGSPANAVFVDNAGNVGMGTTAPTARLDVRGGPMLVESLGDQADLLWLASERSWVFRQEGAGVAAALKLESVGGGGNKNFIVQTTGFMGIGTTAPAAKLDVRGDVRLGPSGQYFAPGGTENLRIIRGTVRGDGVILAGSGFTVQNVIPGQGFYRITYTTPFAGAASVTVSARRPAGAALRWVYASNSDTGGVNVTGQLTQTTATDTDFDFCAIGPR